MQSRSGYPRFQRPVTNVSPNDLGDIRRKLRHLFTRLEELIEQRVAHHVQESQISCIRVIIIQYQQIYRLGHGRYNENTVRLIDVLWDCARRNENSLIRSITRGTLAVVERQGFGVAPNIIEGDVFEYHSDDEQQ